MKWIITDLDHTMADGKWRDREIPTRSTSEDWDKYHEQSIYDQPIPAMIAMLNALASQGIYSAIVTARPEKWRSLTMRWLRGVDVTIHALLMRGDDDYRPSPLVKVDLVNKFFAHDIQSVLFAIDDRDDIITAYRGMGLNCLQCYARMM